MRKRFSLITTISLTALQGPNAAIESLNFLLGKWVGEGTAERGQAGSGSCSCGRGLQDKVLSHAEYPPADGRPRRCGLMYTVRRPGHMTITFEMAPPGKPDQFQKFIDGKLRRSNEAS